MKVVSFFSGCGGLDLGFEQAGFEVVWANDNDPAVKETYLLNHPGTYLCQKDMRELAMGEIPECDGFLGGLRVFEGHVFKADAAVGDRFAG